MAKVFGIPFQVISLKSMYLDIQQYALSYRELLSLASNVNDKLRKYLA
jgi:hypothetical protein